jgi:hypothetical protein
MKTYLILFSILISTCVCSQEYFSSSVWNFKIKQITEPLIIQDEHNNFTASFDIENDGLMLLEIFPRNRNCPSDSMCIEEAVGNVKVDIENQDRVLYSGLSVVEKKDITKMGYSGLRTSLSNSKSNVIIDIYITEGFLYVLSIAASDDPELYYPYLDTFEFMEETREHGERKNKYQ